MTVKRYMLIAPPRFFASKLIFATLLLLAGAAALAAIPVRQASGEKHETYLADGVFVGGRDHGPLALLNMRHSRQSGSGLDRIVFDLGPQKANEDAGRPGFFHASIQTKPRRIVIDLENVVVTKVTAPEANKLLAKSPFVSKVIYYVDQLNKSLTIEMPLKTAAQIEVFELAAEGKPGRIVMDVKAP